YRLQIECRAADDLEHVGGGGLLLQRFGEVVRALAQLFQQPSVFDRDNRLAGKALDQVDLLVGKRSDFRAVDYDRSDQLIFLEHWHNDMRPRAGRFDKRDDAWSAVEIALVKPKVGDVYDLVGSRETVERAARLIAHDNHRVPPKPVGIFRVAVHRHRAKIGPLSQEQIANLRFADTRRILQHRVKHWLQLAGRT